MQPSDITRLSRPRPYRDYGNPRQTKIVNNREYTWSDNVYGLLGTIDNGTKNFYIAVDDRNRLQSHLKEHGIDSKVHYEYVLGDLPLAQDRNISRPDLMAISVMLSRGVLSLPIYPELTDMEVEYITSTVIDLYK